MKPGKLPLSGKRKRTSTVGEGSEEEGLSSGSGVLKRAKHVTTTDEEEPTSGDMTIVHPDPPVAVAHPPVFTAPATTGPVTDPLHLLDAAPPTTGRAPNRPRLIPSRGRGPKAVNNATFNKRRAYNYAPLDDAAVAVRKDRGSKTKSEALGEEGAVAYLRAFTGYDDIELHHATPRDPHLQATTVGQRWSHAVGFNGAGVADITYYDGLQVHVIEAKGGGSQLGQRKQARFHENTNGEQLMDIARPAWENNQGAQRNLNNVLADRGSGDWKTFQSGDRIPSAVKNYSPSTLYQGTIPYLTDIAHTMAKSTKGDGRAMVGQSILDNIANMHYQPVSTQATDVDVTVQTMDVEKGKG